MHIVRAFVLSALAASVSLAQDKTPKPLPPLAEAKKKALDELNVIAVEMEKKGYKGEVGDAQCIARKLEAWDKPMRSTGGSTPFPGFPEYEENVLVPWSALGTRLSGTFAEAAKACDEKAKEEERRGADATGKVEKAKAEFMRQLMLKDKDEAELISGWFKTFADVAQAMRQLNRRRKFGNMGPATCSWAGSLGGFFHGCYLHLNSNHPSTAGLGAHNEDPKLPGWTVEGSDAAGGILAGGSPEGAIDGWIGSAFHRSPVFDRGCGRVALGGGFGGWSCKSGGGMAGKTTSQISSFPGDGDGDIPTVFGGEAPNPLPNGMQSSGTYFVFEFFGTSPQKPTWKLTECSSGAEVETITIQKHNPIQFVAKAALKGETKYQVEILGTNQTPFKYTMTFTTGAGYGRRQPAPPPPDTGKQPPADPPKKSGGSAGTGSAWVGLELYQQAHSVTVRGVQAESPAKAAGFEDGDTIGEFNGEVCNKIEQLKKLLAGLKPGAKVEVRVLRGEDWKKLSVTIGAATKPVGDDEF